MSFSTDAPYSSSRLKFTDLTDVEREKLFYLYPICQTVYDSMRKAGTEPWSSQEEDFLNADSNRRAEWLFGSRLLASYGSSIPQIRHLLDSTPPSLLLDELTERRDELIMRLAGTNAGQHWMKCMKMAGGWSYIARFVCGAESRLASDEVDSFFMTLDQIAIMHDLIKGRGKKYGFDFKPMNEESIEAFKGYCNSSKNAKAILELLHQKIDSKDTPKRSSRPIRAAIEAEAIDRPPYDWFEKEFGDYCTNNKSSYNEYTNPSKDPYNEDPLYNELVEAFRKFK